MKQSQIIQTLIQQKIRASHICNEFYANMNSWTVYRRNGHSVEWRKFIDGQWTDWSLAGYSMPDWAGVIRWELAKEN